LSRKAHIVLLSFGVLISVCRAELYAGRVLAPGSQHLTTRMIGIHRNVIS